MEGSGTGQFTKLSLPPPVKAADPNRWVLADSLGPPDLIVRSTPYTIAAKTQDKWFRPVTETGLKEARWVRAIEIKPVKPEHRKVVHHVLTLLEQQETDGITNLAHEAHGVQRSAGLFMEWAVGKVGEIFAADAGKLMLPDSKIRWEVHLHAIGEEMKNVEVVLPTEDSAIIAYEVHQTGDMKGQPMDLRCADSSVWVKEGGCWKCALHTETILQDAKARQTEPA